MNQCGGLCWFGETSTMANIVPLPNHGSELSVEQTQQDRFRHHQTFRWRHNRIKLISLPRSC